MEQGNKMMAANNEITKVTVKYPNSFRKIVKIAYKDDLEGLETATKKMDLGDSSLISDLDEMSHRYYSISALEIVEAKRKGEDSLDQFVANCRFLVFQRKVYLYAKQIVENQKGIENNFDNNEKGKIKVYVEPKKKMKFFPTFGKRGKK